MQQTPDLVGAQNAVTAPVARVSDAERMLEVERWIRQHLAAALDVTPEEINPQAKFKSLGLDSVVIVELAADLEEWLHVTLSPTLFYDHPTLEMLLNYLKTQLG